MIIDFEKYHGAGNDFILIDNRNKTFPEKDIKLIKHLCSQKFGIGSDGLMLIQHSDLADFEMIFFNPDGSKSLCGNGSRCAVHMAHELNMCDTTGSFITTDGKHHFKMLTQELVSIEMRDVHHPEKHSGYWFLNTGSPHLIIPVEDVDAVDVVTTGRTFRNDAVFIPINGTNVNFVSPGENENTFFVRTYERGVEGETLSCGTGVTAVALAMSLENDKLKKVDIRTRGGELEVSFEKKGNAFANIWLTGAVKHVFSGKINA